MATSAQSTKPQEIDLFLVGKTGQGKSSLGNTILGRQVFQVSDDAESETLTVQVGWSKEPDYIFKVVDSPGLYDNRLEKGDAAKKVEKDMYEGIMHCPKGFHAMLYVLKYGCRFTEEDLNTLDMLKALFGSNFVRDYCIIVFTQGEQFDMNNKRTPGRTFEDWCKKQQGALQNLLQECNNKPLLFYNNEPEKHEEQMHELIALVSNMKSRGVRYTSDIFKKAAATREQFIIKENAPELREKFQKKISFLDDSIEKMMAKKVSFSEAIVDLKKIKQDAIELKIEIGIQDKDTKVLDSQRQSVDRIIRIIDNYQDGLREKQSDAEKEQFFNNAKQEIKLTHEVLQAQNSKENWAETFRQMVQVGSTLLQFMHLAINGASHNDTPQMGFRGVFTPVVAIMGVDSPSASDSDSEAG